MEPTARPTAEKVLNRVICWQISSFVNGGGAQVGPGSALFEHPGFVDDHSPFLSLDVSSREF